jgi:hypothetical protein
MTNIFMEGEWAVSADDAEWLLRMVEEAHQPFVAGPASCTLPPRRDRSRDARPAGRRDSLRCRL